MCFTSVLFKKPKISDNSSEISFTVIALVWVNCIIDQNLKLSDVGVNYV